MDSDDIFSHIRSVAAAAAAEERDRLTGQSGRRSRRTDDDGLAPPLPSSRTIAVLCPWRNGAFRGLDPRGTIQTDYSVSKSSNHSKLRS